MLLILGLAAPLAALLVIATYRVRLRPAATASSAVQDTPLGGIRARRWEGLAEQIARQGHRPRRSDAAVRRRHLTAVLAADAPR